MPFFVDLNVLDGSTDVKRQEGHKYDDRSIFKYGLTYVQHHDSLNKYIFESSAKGNLLSFPEKEFQVCLTLNREDKANKYFQLYDVFERRVLRKVHKQESLLVKYGEDSDAFAVDIDAKVLVYACGEDLVLQSLRIPDPIHKHIKPRYNLALHKENPAKIA